MPSVRKQDPWETALRSQVRALGKGWGVQEERGRVRVNLRPPGEKSQSVTLEIQWSERSAGDAYTRVRNLFGLVVGEGYNLRQAADVAAGKAPKLTERTDWSGAMERFRDQKLHHGTAIKPQTWAGGYEPVLTDAIALLTSRNPPTTPADLIDACIRRWEPGSRTRQERARNLAQFLTYCTTRERFPAVWQPPPSLKDHIGRKPATAEAGGSDPVSDQEIINLIASFPDDGPGRRWADAIRLLAELGLRPVELTYLGVRTDPKTSQSYWWCSYQKRAGGGVTRPRRLYPLPLIDGDGEMQRWNLLQRWEAGLLRLPEMDESSRVALRVNQYLRRRPAWMALIAAAAARDERVTTYSFRHSYSVRGHQRGIDSGSMALAMGHSLEVHCRSYPWATESGAENAFNRAMQNAALVR
ncbi:site-specific integrase [Synechococcus sp. HK01-R]|nr:site-specific integrase [Synechococcus sp. HK01-R]